MIQTTSVITINAGYLHFVLLVFDLIIRVMMKCLYPLWLLVFSVIVVPAVQAQTAKIPLMRQAFHDKVDDLQTKILRLDGTPDKELKLSDDEDMNLQLTYTATKRIDALQADIESGSDDSNSKIRYLRALAESLDGFLRSYYAQTMRYAQLPVLVNAFSEGMQLDREGKSIVPFVAAQSFDIDNLLTRSVLFEDHKEYDEVKNIVFLKDCRQHPDKILKYLSANSKYPFTDSLISISARYDEDELYTYAAANNTLAYKIAKSPDTLVQVISKLSKLKSGRQYFPFLDNLYRGKITIPQIDAVKEDPLRYYRLLVSTKIDYTDRMLQHDTPMGMDAIESRLEYAGKHFINEINGLHESSDAVRFRILEKLTPEELYYLAVMQEEIIYTSSYVRGVYPRIFQKMKVPRGDSLLVNVRFDHFKKWIKMAANYNTLDDFLKRMDKQNALVLMKAFVSGLDKRHGKDSLEDAVDVAGSYASIYDKSIQQLVLSEVQQNLAEANLAGNHRAQNIYSILNTLFLSMDSANHIDVSKELSIRPVYFMTNNTLKDTTGKIIVQQFFYGDKDGQNVFNAFVRSYSNANWKMTSSPYWVTFTSTRGLPISIYSNRPLDEEQGLDDKAQAALTDYLLEHDLRPSVVLHRGHSYYLNNTINQMPSSAQVILLGSCGGYQSLNQILKICPEAHIISSKQTGSGLINLPLINGIMDNLRQGKDLNWPVMWQAFSKEFGGGDRKELFDDYVPPYKNLGAVFIMAYTKLQEKDNG